MAFKLFGIYYYKALEPLILSERHREINVNLHTYYPNFKGEPTEQIKITLSVIRKLCNKIMGINANISFQTSKNDRGIQIADFMCGLIRDAKLRKKFHFPLKNIKFKMNPIIEKEARYVFGNKKIFHSL